MRIKSTRSSRKPDVKDFLPEIDGLEYVQMNGNEHSFEAKLSGDTVFRVHKVGDNLDVIMASEFPYYKNVYSRTGRRCSINGDKYDAKAFMLKYIEEVREWRLASDKAVSTQAVVQEISDIYKYAHRSNNPTEKALNELSNGNPVVEIVYDGHKGKFRAQATWRGQTLWCVFPSKLRAEGAVYVVDGLVERNGCWHVVGNIKPLVGS